MKKTDADRVRKLVRGQIVQAIRADMGGRGELLMKECWEELNDAAEFALADEEMGRIIKAISSLPMEAT